MKAATDKKPSAVTDISKYEFSAIKLNSKFLIIEKNAAAKANMLNLRLETSIMFYVSEKDGKAIRSMQAGDEIAVTILSEYIVDASVIYDGNEFIVHTDSLAIALRKRIDAICSIRNSNLAYLETIGKNANSFSLTEYDKNFKNILYLEQHMNDYITYIINPKPEKGQSCDIAKALYDMTAAIRLALKKTHIDIFVTAPTGEFYTFIPPKDLHYILFTCTTLCFFLSADKSVVLRVHRIGGKIVVAFHFDDFRIPDLVDELDKCIKESDFSYTNGEAAFLLVYLKTLCSFYDVNFELSTLSLPDKAVILLEFDEFGEEDIPSEFHGNEDIDKAMLKYAEKAVAWLQLYFDDD